MLPDYGLREHGVQKDQSLWGPHGSHRLPPGCRGTAGGNSIDPPAQPSAEPEALSLSILTSPPGLAGPVLTGLCVTQARVRCREERPGLLGVGVA